MLRKTWRGVLGLCDDGRPYMIPIAHVFEGESLYFFFAKAGRKIQIIRKNPHACYLTSIEDVNEIVTVLVEGILEHLEKLEDMKKIVKIFVEKIFPKDPYFRLLRELSEDHIVEMCYKGKIPGIYKLEIANLTGIAVTRR